jgi:hypothetical protein
MDALLLPPPAQSTQEPQPTPPLSAFVESSILLYLLVAQAAMEASMNTHTTAHCCTHFIEVQNLFVWELNRAGNQPGARNIAKRLGRNNQGE